jgi:hypothetical protein
MPENEITDRGTSTMRRIINTEALLPDVTTTVLRESILDISLNELKRT